MSRARNIKPGFFRNENLGECSPLARLLFAGLWCEADREGRLEDRPKRLKAEVLPYDNCDVSLLLGELEQWGFICRYQHGNGRYIQVLNFSKHQNPHVKEGASVIPAPDMSGASPVQAPDKEQPQPERAGLIPDSLIPDTGLPPSTEGGSPPAPSRPSETASGSRLPKDWVLPETWAAEAKRILAELNRPDISIPLEADKFRDHWAAQPGQKGRKSDWPGTWRNWVRKSCEYQRGPPLAKQSAIHIGQQDYGAGWGK